MFRRLLPTVVFLLLGATVLAAAASGGPWGEAAYGPVIGKPTTVPIGPLAGKGFVAVQGDAQRHRRTAHGRNDGRRPVRRGKAASTQ
jgi:hypothetical protein